MCKTCKNTNKESRADARQRVVLSLEVEGDCQKLQATQTIKKDLEVNGLSIET